jgi:hypothetical protein
LSPHTLISLGRRGRSSGGWQDLGVSEGDGASPLQNMYRVDGSSDLTEQTLDHFEGWRGLRPLSSAAVNQDYQLDRGVGSPPYAPP